MNYRIIPTGDCALQVEFENTISIEVNSFVVALRTRLEELNLPEITETLQAYRSLMIHYKPEITLYEELERKLIEILKDFRPEETVRTEKSMVEIPVLYGDEWGIDLQEVADAENLSTDEVIKKHSTNPNYIYFIGFSPGLPYMGNPEPTFSVPRRMTPRVRLPRGCVTIWKEQTTIFPVEQPGGWNVIGRTPLILFDLNRDPVFLLHAGQWVKFRPISRQEYEEIEHQVQEGSYEIKTYREG